MDCNFQPEHSNRFILVIQKLKRLYKMQKRFRQLDGKLQSKASLQKGFISASPAKMFPNRSFIFCKSALFALRIAINLKLFFAILNHN